MDFLKKKRYHLWTLVKGTAGRKFFLIRWYENGVKNAVISCKKFEIWWNGVWNDEFMNFLREGGGSEKEQPLVESHEILF